MKIIEEKKWKMEVTCDSGCHSLLEIEKEDVIAIEISADYYSVKYQVKCPVCNTDIPLDHMKIPSGIREMAKKGK